MALTARTLRMIALLAAGLAALPAAAQQPGRDQQLLRVKRVAAIDQNGFEKPLPAFSMLVPHHWKTGGGVVWNPQNACSSIGYNFAFEAASPDGAYGVSVLPTVSWTSYHGFEAPATPCAQVDLRSAQAFLQWYVAQLVPGVRFLDYRPRRDLAEGYRALAAQTPLGGGAYSETAVDAGEILVAFSENGRDLRGTVAAAVILWHTHMPGMPSMMAGVPSMPGIDIYGGSNMPAFGAFAPAGALDLRTAEMIRKSIVPSPEWSRRIAEHHAVINRQNLKASRDRHNITMKMNREIGEIITKGYEERSAIRDRGHRETVEAIRGVETYDDPYHGGTVELDNTYRHAWQLDDGTYVLTDDESFNPYAVLGRDGQRLNPTR